MRINTHFQTDTRRHNRIIAGEDFDRHAVIPQRGNRFSGAFFRRIEKSEHPFDGKFGLILHT